ncbi:Ldh family oxidoreductase [Rhizobium sp. 32-5/1]|uniref:Ldh family oxidoreductase n=1 Tax=Rhizobium sp. 32-5/1 TaxID=3019602 RepID=UPI0032B79FC6
MAFAAPRASGEPIVFDQASSLMAHGDVQVAARRGHLLPEGAGIDRLGRPTSSPHAILNGGAINTFGGHKGASIALMVELLCAALVGADFSFEVDWSKNPGARTARTGETIIVIDPAAGADGLPSFAARTDVLVRALADAGQGRMPGDRRLLARSSDNDQIPLSAEDWSTIETFGQG